jgi:hypothetical protein
MAGGQETRLSPLEYSLYGVICAARRETGPAGARRMYRIQDRACIWDDAAVAVGLLHLIELGWIRQLPPDEFGYVYFELAD